MTEYLVTFWKNGQIDPGPRGRRVVRVEAIDEVAAKAVAAREFFDRTFRIVKVEEAT